VNFCYTFIVTCLVYKYVNFYATPSFLAKFIIPCYWILIWASSIQFTSTRLIFNLLAYFDGCKLSVGSGGVSYFYNSEKWHVQAQNNGLCRSALCARAFWYICRVYFKTFNSFYKCFKQTESRRRPSRAAVRCFTNPWSPPQFWEWTFQKRKGKYLMATVDRSRSH
jgi:hypothetical protein